MKISNKIFIRTKKNISNEARLVSNEFMVVINAF